MHDDESYRESRRAVSVSRSFRITIGHKRSPPEYPNGAARPPVPAKPRPRIWLSRNWTPENAPQVEGRAPEREEGAEGRPTGPGLPAGLCLHQVLTFPVG